MATVNEVYAQNILPRQIAERISFVGIDVTDESIQEERNAFLTWLNTRYEKFGKLFSDQVSAWEMYDSYEKRERELDKIHKIEDNDVEDTPRWETEIIDILESLSLSNMRNYNEFGGQL